VSGRHQKYFGKTQQSKLVKTRRDSAEVHAECKSVLVHLMANRQARKISSAGIMAWKDQKRKLHFEFRIPGVGGFKEVELFIAK
jgi:hypothetical protein